jgi:predicted Zn-dependent peptidase
MIDFRNTAPLSKKISTLEYRVPEEHSFGDHVRLYQSKPAQNEVVKLQLFIPGGSRFQSRKNQARGAATLSLSGTSQHTSDQIQEQIEYWGSSVDFDSHVFGTDISIKALKKNFIDTVSWVFEHHVEALYPESEIAIYQQTEYAAMQRKLTTPRYWAGRKSSEAVFGLNSPMTGYSDLEDLKQIDRDTLLAYHKQWIQPGMGVWYLSGDTDASTVSALHDIWKMLPNAQVQAVPQEREFSPAAAKHIEHPIENTSQVSMVLCRELPAIDEIQFHKMGLLNLILGGFFGSRLMQEIREERGLTYGIGSYISQTTRGNMWNISGEMNSQNARQALEATREIMQSMIDNPPAGEELNRAKSYYAGQVRSSFDGPFAMANKMRGLHLRGYTYRHLDLALDTVWSTDTAELCALADNYLRPDTFYSALAGDILP